MRSGPAPRGRPRERRSASCRGRGRPSPEDPQSSLMAAQSPSRTPCGPPRSARRRGWGPNSRKSYSGSISGSATCFFVVMALRRRCSPRADDADAPSIDKDDNQQSTGGRQPHDHLPTFPIDGALGHKSGKPITEHGLPFGEGDPVLASVCPGLLSIPLKLEFFHAPPRQWRRCQGWGSSLTSDLRVCALGECIETGWLRRWDARGRSTRDPRLRPRRGPPSGPAPARRCAPS